MGYNFWAIFWNSSGFWSLRANDTAWNLARAVKIKLHCDSVRVFCLVTGPKPRTLTSSNAIKSFSPSVTAARQRGSTINLSWPLDSANSWSFGNTWSRIRTIITWKRLRRWFWKPIDIHLGVEYNFVVEKVRTSKSLPSSQIIWHRLDDERYFPRFTTRLAIDHDSVNYPKISVSFVASFSKVPAKYLDFILAGNFPEYILKGRLREQRTHFGQQTLVLWHIDAVLLSRLLLRRDVCWRNVKWWRKKTNQTILLDSVNFIQSRLRD